MNISSRCEYACRAMVELSAHEQNVQPLPATIIAERRAIPEKYLVHILLQLKRAGLVRSVRGAQGGYFLARAADQITLFDVVRAIDGAVLDPLPVEDAESTVLAPAWREVATGVEKVLTEYTFRDLLERSAKAHMYYI
ncbi:MAG: hypothetical protein AMXMBFR84_49790 [Candidatus Hydrogenedentota bacterium]